MPRLRQLFANGKKSRQRRCLEVYKEMVLKHVSPSKLKKDLCKLCVLLLQQVLETV